MQIMGTYVLIIHSYCGYSWWYYTWCQASKHAAHEDRVTNSEMIYNSLQPVTQDPSLKKKLLRICKITIVLRKSDKFITNKAWILSTEQPVFVPPENTPNFYTGPWHRYSTSCSTLSVGHHRIYSLRIYSLSGNISADPSRQASYLFSTCRFKCLQLYCHKGQKP